MRRVRRLQLSAPSERLCRRGQFLLEDALRTASLPAADDARLWLVRSLKLGSIDPRGSPGRLALRIEERLRQSGLEACAGGEAGADQAPVVVFASALDAAIALAERLARGEPARAWYWPLAVPAFQARASRGDALRAILWSCFDLPGGGVAAAVWLEALARRDALDAEIGRAHV